MKLTLIILMFFSLHLNAQVKRAAMTTKVEITGKVFNKSTGEKITDKEFAEIIQKNPNLVLERLYNKYGYFEKYFYDPDSILTGKERSRNEENQAKPGEKFGDFVFRTVDNEVVESDKLLGKWIFLRFELYSRFINKEEILSLSTQIDESKNKDNLLAIICMADSKAKVKEDFDSDKLAFKLVSDGRNFHEIFNIMVFPSSVLINPEGIVVKYFSPGDNIDIDKMIGN